MTTDFRVQMAPFSPHCVPASALACLEGMANKEVISDPAEVFAKLTDEGLTVPGGVLLPNILPAMALVGEWGAKVVAGLVHGDGAYPVTPSQMVDALRQGMRPFMFVYRREDNTAHAVCAIGVDDQTVALVDPVGGPIIPAPVSEVIRLGTNGYGYSSHRLVQTARPPVVDRYWDEQRVYLDWANARWVNHESHKDRNAFVAHLRNLGVPQPTNVERWGWPCPGLG